MLFTFVLSFMLISVYCLSHHNKSVLVLLMWFEVIGILNSWAMVWIGVNYGDLSVIVVYLVFLVVEAILGLSFVVSLSMSGGGTKVPCLGLYS